MMFHFAFVALAAGDLSQREGLQPGQWAITVDLTADTANGEPLTSPHTDHQEEKICLAGGDATSPELLVSEAVPNGCQVGQIHAAKGEIDFTAACPADEDGVSIDIRGTGTYSRSEITVSLEASAEADGNRATMSGNMLANRTGACEAPRSR